MTAPSRREHPPDPSGDAAIGRKPVIAAVERHQRIVIPDPDFKSADGAAANIGRIRHHEIEAARDPVQPVGRNEFRPLGDPEAARIVGRDRQCRGAEVGGNAAAGAELAEERDQDGAAAGAKVENAGRLDAGENRRALHPPPFRCRASDRGLPA